MKEKIVLGVGIIAFLFVTAVIVDGINQCNDDTAKAADATTDMLLTQKDVAIAKLLKQIKMKDAALVTAKAHIGAIETKLDANTAKLEGAIKKIDTIKEEINTPISVETSSKK